jgi:integrase
MVLRKRINRAGSVSWQIDYGVVDGKRKRVSFEDKAEAERALVAAKDSRKRLGALGVTASPLEMAEFLAVRERLRSCGASILEAVEFFMEHGLKVRHPKLMPALVEDFIWSRIELGRDVRTIQTYRHVLRALARAFPLRHAHEMTREDLKAWRRSQGWSPATQNKAMGHVRGLFKWAIAEKHAGLDPCEGLEEVTVSPAEVEVLSLRSCEALLMTGLKVPRFMPFLVLGLFRGMRRSELERLRWEEINLESGSVIASAAKVKTRRRRVMELTPQMRAWISAAGWTEEMMQTGPVAPSNLKVLWPKFWRQAGLPRWPHNGLRHTFASMHYAMHQDEAALQAILGQRSADVLHTNYRALKTRGEAERFFALMPTVGVS